VPLPLGDVEGVAGRELTLEELKRVIGSAAPHIADGSVRLLIYGVFPEEDGKGPVCIATDVSTLQGDILLKAKCLDSRGSATSVEAIAMDCYKYVFVITGDAAPSRELEVYRDMERVARRLYRNRKARKGVIKVTLMLTPSQAELEVESISAEAVRELNGWFRRWLATKRYTPLFLFNTMVRVLRENSMRVLATVMEVGGGAPHSFMS